MNFLIRNLLEKTDLYFFNKGGIAYTKKSFDLLHILSELWRAYKRFPDCIHPMRTWTNRWTGFAQRKRALSQNSKNTHDFSEYFGGIWVCLESHKNIIVVESVQWIAIPCITRRSWILLHWSKSYDPCYYMVEIRKMQRKNDYAMIHRDVWSRLAYGKK